MNGKILFQYASRFQARVIEIKVMIILIRPPPQSTINFGREAKNMNHIFNAAISYNLVMLADKIASDEGNFIEILSGVKMRTDLNNKFVLL